MTIPKHAAPINCGMCRALISPYHGPLTATINDLVPPSGHATPLGLYYLVNLFAKALAPLIRDVCRGRDRNCAQRYYAPSRRLANGVLFCGDSGLLLGLRAMRLPGAHRDHSEEHTHLRELLRLLTYIA